MMSLDSKGRGNLQCHLWWKNVKLLFSQQNLPLNMAHYLFLKGNQPTEKPLLWS